MKKLLLTFLVIALPLAAIADEPVKVEINNIMYYLYADETGSFAEVAPIDLNHQDGIVEIPASITYEGKKYSVTSIGENAFKGGWLQTSITIPNSVTSIGDHAFEGCYALTSTNIPNSVTSIGESAFAKCSALTSINIPNSVTSIGESAFAKCSALTSINIPNSVTYIGKGAFANCSKRTTIKVEDGNNVYDSRNSCNAIIETATGALLAGCKNTVIPNSVTRIGDYAFAGCSPLTSINIPNSVTYIGDYAFQYCEGLTSIIIPNSVTYIGDYAFRSCYGLTSINIPNSVTSIGKSAFQECRALTSINIPNSVTSIGDYAFEGCEGLTSITIPNSVTSIERGTFVDCYGLTSIIIPNSVTSIGQSAFQNCRALTSITIPKSVTSLGDWAISGCSGLTFVKVEWNYPLAISDYRFTVNRSATLYVPKETAWRYKAASVWKEFKNIQEYDDDEDAHYITIRMGEGGVLKQMVETGNTYIYMVEADEGWEVNTLTFNGKDMTTLLQNGQFSTPVITGSSELNVVFKQRSTEVKERVADTDVKVYVNGRTLTVRGADEDAEVHIYTTGGMNVTSAKGNATLTLDSGIYIVKVGKDTFKVRM